MNRTLTCIAIILFCSCHTKTMTALYSSGNFSMFSDSIVQANYTAKALSDSEIVSDYQSPYRTDNPKDSSWHLSNDISLFPKYHSPYLLTDALYNLALSEMQHAIEPDSTFRTGKLWAGVWTRDISYSTILSMAILQPIVAVISLKRKVKNGKIIQDTGTGGSYPVSTDRIIWAIAAWEVYKVTGDKEWLQYTYNIIKNSVNDDEHNAYDIQTGMVKGESSFLDWREQTYPVWMQPADIYESECLGTNAVHYQANTILAEMSSLLGLKNDEIKYKNNAANIKQGINRYLWQPSKGYYGQYLYGRNNKILSPKSEALGEALAVLFDISDSAQQQSIIEHTPVTPFGISCIYPQIPGIPPYHNNAVWPFVESFWALASAKAGNETSVIRAMSDVYRPAALFLTNKENFVADNGDYAGTQINSSNMLWSLSGNISLVYRLLFGMQFNPDNLLFHPFVPEIFKGRRTLDNFKYRNAVLDIEMDGYGNGIKDFKLDGKHIDKNNIPASLTGRHQIYIQLNNTLPKDSKIHAVTNKFSPQEPITTFQKYRLSWKGTAINIAYYKVYNNGKLFRNTKDTFISISDSNRTVEWHVIAVNKDSSESFASEPVLFYPKDKETIVQLENFNTKYEHNLAGFTGNGFVRTSTSLNRNISCTITIKQKGIYSLDIRYSNGNGPINTLNKCAMRTLSLDGKPLTTLVFPQRGNAEWGWSNSIPVKLDAGKHILQVSFEPSNENMNGQTNEASLDCLRLIQN